MGVTFATAFLAYAILSMPGPVGQYAELVKSRKGDAVNASLFTADPAADPLMVRIQAEAAKRAEKPVNARVDPVWKAIPAYNGVQVDIHQTYRINKEKSNHEELQLVYREIPAAVQLEHLPPNPVYKGNPRKPMVSLMINVAWGDEYIPSMLKSLEDANVKATFFLDGSWLKSHEETARTIMAAGHELSNHAYSHKDMSKISNALANLEISKTEVLLKKLGIQNKLFAPPSGDFDEETVRIAYSMKLQTILWTLDTVDWQKPSPESVIHKITTRVEAGSMILMHPTEASSKALPAMIKGIKGKGYVLGTVSELLSPQRVPKVEQSFAF
ncbi:hypothetical protein SY83_16290 [Paenibacillus swuensis]|uniref:NodB homology domain-containing protein n=1 Tax=Paenibacillus swuensis TaxID=1178515 RepID=A0A172TPJ9_9BACL|nr:hypothetical protein SY83_16290 [Paenibacillus swuensis]